jgi:hypothetical protein
MWAFCKHLDSHLVLAGPVELRLRLAVLLAVRLLGLIHLLLGHLLLVLRLLLLRLHLVLGLLLRRRDGGRAGAALEAQEVDDEDDGRREDEDPFWR